MLGRWFVLVLGGLLASSCVRLTLAWADLKPDGAPAAPSVLAASENGDAIDTVEAWETRRAPALRAAFEQNVHGVMPAESETSVLEKRVLDEAAFNGAGRLEEWKLSATARFGEVRVRTREVMESGGFYIQIVTPTGATGPTPVIMMETFCPWWDVIAHPEVTRPEDAESMSGGVFGAVASYVFGRYICSPPIETILERGYAIASIYPGAVVPDSKTDGLSELNRLAAGHQDDATRWGAVAAWSWIFSRVTDALEADARFDRDGFIVWGHSRYGKAALAAAAFDPRIDGVIAHQSGTGGASLNRDKPGESVGSMTENYPHWFSKTYAGFAGREEELPIDQHQLLALIAPRPVLLGNARRDVWSDPNGAFRAAVGADAVYELYGREGLNQKRLDQWRPSSDIAFWIRPGTHGVVKEDWPAFLEFLDAHFMGSASEGASAP
ncbi:MAG: alpha/beta hydrolase [Pseudomonadota bacterium]